MTFEPAVDQIWRHRDRRRERFLKIIDVFWLDVYVRSCDLRGEFCPKTPRMVISINRLTNNYRLLISPATLSIESHNS